MEYRIFVQEYTWNIKYARIGIVECAIARWRGHRVSKKSSHVFSFDRKKNRRKSEGLRDDNANFAGVEERSRRATRHEPRIYTTTNGSHRTNHPFVRCSETREDGDEK